MCGKKRKKKGVEKNVGSFHPIHKITKWDFLDGALVGVGSLRPYFDQLSKLVTGFINDSDILW